MPRRSASRPGERRKSLPGGPSPLALPSGGDKLVERGVAELRVDDVLTIDGKDFLVEGMINYDEDGHRWIGARVVDGGDVKWLVVGIERAGTRRDAAARAGRGDPDLGLPAGGAGDRRRALRARQARRRDLRAARRPRLARRAAEGSPRRPRRARRWWLYSAPGDDTLLLEQWGSDYRVLRGKKIGDGTIELIPGS